MTVNGYSITCDGCGKTQTLVGPPRGLDDLPPDEAMRQWAATWRLDGDRDLCTDCDQSN